MSTSAPIEYRLGSFGVPGESDIRMTLFPSPEGTADIRVRQRSEEFWMTDLPILTAQDKWEVLKAAAMATESIHHLRRIALGMS